MSPYSMLSLYQCLFGITLCFPPYLSFLYCTMLFKELRMLGTKSLLFCSITPPFSSNSVFFPSITACFRSISLCVVFFFNFFFWNNSMLTLCLCYNTLPIWLVCSYFWYYCMPSLSLLVSLCKTLNLEEKKTPSYFIHL